MLTKIGEAKILDIVDEETIDEDKTHDVFANTKKDLEKNSGNKVESIADGSTEKN